MYLCVCKFDKNSVITQKQQCENGVSESIFCVSTFVDSFLLETRFVLKFSPVIQYV